MPNTKSTSTSHLLLFSAVCDEKVNVSFMNEQDVTFDIAFSLIAVDFIGKINHWFMEKVIGILINNENNHHSSSNVSSFQ